MKKIKEVKKINNEDSILNSKDPTVLVNNEENTENRFIKNKNEIILKKENNIDNLTLEETFLLRYSDPINSIALTDEHLLFGSMIGKVVLYNITSKKTYKLYEMTNENIMGCSLEAKVGNKKIFYVSIGDESVISLEEKENDNKELEIQTNTIKNYDNQQIHMNNCAQAFTMLWNNQSLILYLYHATKFDEDIATYATFYYLFTYSIKNKQKELMEEGTINMSNYSVPFDFRYNCFLFLEYIHDKEQNENRNLCIYRFQGKESNKYILMNLDNDFGHVSFAKILNQNLVLIVRKYNLIEIYDIEKEYETVGDFLNDSEINAIDYYVTTNNENNGSKKEESEDIINIKVTEEQYYFIIFMDVNQNIIELKFENKPNNSYKKNLEINIKKNINDIKGIGEELKNKGLFLLDFPYYIKNSPKYIAITTDQACFLLKKNKNL
jgi:hypothetical protein